MPTDPLLGVLDPDGVKAAAAAELALACPLLREILNYSSRVWYVCACVMPQGRDEGIPPARLYFHVLEMLDAIEVQLREVCTYAAKLSLRSAWEAHLQLCFMLRQPRFREASLAWFVSATREKLKELRAIVDLERRARKERDPESAGLGEAVRLARRRIDRIESALKSPHLTAVTAWATDPWYQAFAGGANIEQLAAALERLEREQGIRTRSRWDVAYLTFYRFGSNLVHASEFDRVVATSPDGPRPLPLRGDAGEVRAVASHAASIALGAMRLMVERFVPDRRDEIRAWYVQDVQARYLELVARTPETGSPAATLTF